MLIIIAIIILAILIQKKWQHMSMETDHASHPNSYYNSCKKTKEHSDDGLKNSGCEDINQEPIYEPLGEEPYDVPCKLSDEVPVVPKRENCVAVIKHENMAHLSSNIRKFLLNPDAQDHTSVTQFKNVGFPLSPNTSLSQYESVLGPHLTPKVDTDSSEPYYVNLRPKCKEDAVLSVNETSDYNYV